MTVLFLYDEIAADLGVAVRQLAVHGIDGDRVTTFTNRIELLSAIRQTENVCVALIDLQANEQFARNYNGHRIIDTIRRHPELARRCHPLAYTVHAREDVVDDARRHGAAALLSKNDLDIPPDEVAAVDLRGFLRGLLQTRPPRPPEEFVTFPSIQRARERHARQEANLASSLLSVFTTVPDDASQPWFWQLIRYLAEIDPSAARYWTCTEYPVAGGTIDHALKRLKHDAKPHYRVHGMDWHSMANDLLMVATQHRAPPREEDVLRTLHRIGELQDLIHDERLRSESFLDHDALCALDRVAPGDVSWTVSGHAGAKPHTELLLGRLAELEPDEPARIALQSAFARGVHGIYDTYLARAKSES